MTQTEKSDKSKKTTNEKPVSLYPIPYEEVVRDLLAVKPPPKAEKEESAGKRDSKK